MSISKYHVSTNLLDLQYFIANAQVSPLNARNKYIEYTLKPNTFYTLSSNFYSGSTGCWFITLPNIAPSSATNGVIEESPSRNIQTGNDGKLWLWGRFIASGAASGSAPPITDMTSTDWAMFNEGSTPLPYEPYGDSFKDWFYREYGTETETFTSLPQTIIGDGQNISAYTIKGNMTQSGTPTPSNPVYPQETGDKTANLLPHDYENHSFTWDTGDIKTAIDNTRLASMEYSDIVSGNMTFSITSADLATYQICLFLYDENESYLSNTGWQSFPYTYDVGSSRRIRVSVRKSDNSNIDVTHIFIMMNAGLTSLSYEPYGYKIPILSNGVSYPVYLAEPIRKIGDYADTINSDGTVTRNIYKLIWTGAETGWRSASGVCFNQEITPDYLRAPNKNTLICTHYQSINQVSSASAVGDGQCSLYNTGGSQRMYFKDVDISSTDAFKQYLADQYAAGTPVTVWYVLKTPTTEQTTVPTIPTSGTAQSFDVDTTLKPSEVSLTWHGWHEHSDEKYVGG